MSDRLVTKGQWEAQIYFPKETKGHLSVFIEIFMVVDTSLPRGKSCFHFLEIDCFLTI